MNSTPHATDGTPPVVAATPPIEGSMTYGVSEQLAELFKENASGTLGSELARARCRRKTASSRTNGRSAADARKSANRPRVN